MKIVKYSLLCCLFLLAGTVEAQIRFFEGGYTEALKQAKQEKKDLFVDCWAGWCAPCKLMAEQVFTQQEVGDYFNEKFICLQLDVEEASNKDIVKRFKVEALPTLLFISREDQEIRRLNGARGAEELLKEAKIALGEELSFGQLYEKYKKNKKDFDIQQRLLIEAPAFVMTQEGYNREKWGVRIESLFADYLKNKKLENMINPGDFYILSMYHSRKTKDDPVFDFVVKNYGEFMAAVDTMTIARYIIGLNNSYIIQLCKQGNVAYKESIKRVNGDLSPLYAEFAFGSLSTEEAITLLADATYYLYRHDLPKFFGNMNKYFEGKGKEVELNDYTQPLEDLAIAYEGNIPGEAYSYCIPWIGKALEFEQGNTAGLRTRLLIMLGQCFGHTGDAVKAKQSLNQAFLESAQIEHPGERQQMQQTIQQSLQGIGE